MVFVLLGYKRRIWFQTFQDNLVVCLQKSVCPRWDTRAEFLLRDLYIWGWDQYLFSKRRVISASLRFILILSLHDSLFLFLKLLFSEGNQNQNSLFFYLPVLSTCLTTRISLDFKTLFHIFQFHSLMGQEKKKQTSCHSHCRDWYDTAWPRDSSKEKSFLIWLNFQCSI